MDDHVDTTSLTKLCDEVGSLCTKILEKSNFLLFVNNGAAHAVFSEILSINAEIVMVKAVISGNSFENGQVSPFGLIDARTDMLFERVERSKDYLDMALRATLPDTKGSNLANILCQNSFLAPTTTLFNAVLKELQRHRRSISAGLKGAIELQDTEGYFDNSPGSALSGGSVYPGTDLSAPGTWEGWIHGLLGATGGVEISKLLKLQSQLFARLWLELPGRISTLSQNLPPEVCESGDRLDTKLRDTLGRRLTSKYTMVFVGMQSSGKSMLLNAFLGKTILPSHAYPTTTYPCRIQHVAGKVIPELHLSKSLEIGLSRLREFKWLEKYQGYRSEPRIWTGHDLPTNVKASSLVSTWRACGQEIHDSYSRFMDPSFTIPRIVCGEAEIMEWLKLTNHLTAICQILCLPFESFLFHDWAVVLLEFLALPETPTDGICEVIDIPGLDNSHTWDDVIQEVIRDANAIVAVVSQENFGTWAWAGTAALIEKATSLPVSAVILTKMDTPVLGTSHAKIEQVLKDAFWHPDRNMNQQSKFIFPCSVLARNASIALLALIEREGTKPMFQSLLTMPYSPYFGFQDLEDAESDYAEQSLEQLIATCKRRLQRTKVDEAFQALHQIIRTGVSQQLASEMTGIEDELESLQELIISREPASFGSSTPRTSSVEGQKILQEWSLLQKTVQEEVEALMESSALKVDADIQSKARNAISSALGEALRSSVIPPTIDFREFEALETFVDSVQRAYSTLQVMASENTMHLFLKESRALIQKGASSMQKCIEALQSRPYDLVQPSSPVVPAVEPPFVGDLLKEDDVLQKQHRLLHGFCAFYQWRRRLQTRMANSFHFPTEASDLSTLQRHLLAFMAAITFPIRNVVGIHETLFTLDLGKAQTLLEMIGKEYWETSFLKAFRREVALENEPIWDAGHLAIMMALAGLPEEAQEQEGGNAIGPMSPDVLESSLEQVETIISASRGCLQSLASNLYKPSGR